MARSGWVAVLITALLVGGFGSPAADRAAGRADGEARPLITSVTAFPRWSTQSFAHNSDMVGPIVLKVVLLLAGVFLCAGLAGRVGASMASFLGGWAAVVVSAALAGAVFNLAAEVFVFERHDGLLSQTTVNVNAGALFGLYTGWLVGAAVAITARNARVEPRWIAPVPGPTATDGPAPDYPPGYPPIPIPTPVAAAPVPVDPAALAPWPPTPEFQTPALASPETPPAPAADLAPLPPPPPPPPPEPPADPDATQVDDLPSADPTEPLWSAAWPGSRPGGAYSSTNDEQRPSRDRWSSSDDA